MSWIFNGIDQWVEFLDNEALTFPSGDWTFAGYFKISDTTGTDYQYLCSWNTGQPSSVFELYFAEKSTNNYAEGIGLNITDDMGNSDSKISQQRFLTKYVGQWLFLSVVRSGDTITVEVEEEEALSLTIPGLTSIDAAASMNFGRRSSGDANKYFNGLMINWSKWDRALSRTELHLLRAKYKAPWALTDSHVWQVVTDEFATGPADITIVNHGATIDADEPEVDSTTSLKLSKFVAYVVTKPHVEGPEEPEEPNVPAYNNHQRVFLFGQRASMALQTNTGNKVLDIAYINHPLSDQKIYLGGIPLSLASDGRRYYLAVVEETTSQATDQTVVFYGIRMALKIKNGRNYILHVNEENETELSNSVLNMSGMPLSLNSNYVLLAKKHEPISNFDEESYVYIGGMPLLIRRYGRNWFLVVAK